MIIFLVSLFLALFKSQEISNKETTPLIVKIFMISLNFWIAYYYSFLYSIGIFILSFIQLRLKFQKIKQIVDSTFSDSDIVKVIRDVIYQTQFFERNQQR